MHVFFSCPLATHAWRTLDGYLKISRLCVGSMVDALVHIFWSIPKDLFGLFSIILWCLWNERNNFLHDKPTQDPAMLVKFAKSYLMEFHEAWMYQSN